MTDDEKVVQLRVAEVRLNAAYEDLKGQDEARQRQSCDGFAERFGKDQGEKLRQRLGLKRKAKPAREPAKEDLRQRFKDREAREAREARLAVPKPQPKIIERKIWLVSGCNSRGRQ